MKRFCIGILVLLFIIFQFSYADSPRIKMSTTTSTENSGLLKYILPLFEKDTGIHVDVIAVGTGQALKLAENGDIDVVLVHARALEDQFISNRFGTNRMDVMYNDFVLIGPKDDPASVNNAKTAINAFQMIALKNSIFISRGDKSGTDVKEKEIWKKAGIAPSGSWYREAGKGMEEVILMADQLSGYTLADRATYLSVYKKVNLPILYQGDPNLFNPYGIIAVNPVKRLEITKGNMTEKDTLEKYQSAMKLVNWITSKKGQDLIKSYQIEGQILFYPDAKK